MYSWVNQQLNRQWPTEGYKQFLEREIYVRALALGWSPSIKSLVDPRVHVRLRLK